MRAEEAEEGMRHALVVLDDDKRSGRPLSDEQRGVTESAVRYGAGILDQSSYQGQKLTSKTDREPGNVALKRDVAVERV